MVAETAILSGWKIMGVIDDIPGCTFHNLPYLGTISDFHLGTISDFQSDLNTQFVIAIGENRTREKIRDQLIGRVDWATIIHPQSIISSRVKIGVGTVILAGSIVQTDTFIGDHIILNTGSRIDHDNKIADFVHVAPGAVLTGGVQLEKGVFVGAGAVVTPNVKIKKWSILGAGAVAVQKEYQENQIYVGVPAKKLIK